MRGAILSHNCKQNIKPSVNAGTSIIRLNAGGIITRAPVMTEELNPSIDFLRDELKAGRIEGNARRQIINS